MKKYYRENNPDFRFFQHPMTDFPAHLHSELELIYVQSGSVTAYISGEVYSLTGGNLLLVNPNQVHSFINGTPDCRCTTLIAKPGLLRSYSDTLAEVIPCLPVCRVTQTDPIYILLQMAYAEYRSHRDMDVILSLLSALFGILVRTLEFQRQATGAKKSLHTIMLYCAQHYRENISIDTISKALFLSRSHISHTFSCKLKVSFTEYINSLRLSDAVRLLDERSYSISQVAELSGFSTVRTFNRVFQKHYGCTPTQYRK